jgi:hypothetical protein
MRDEDLRHAVAARIQATRSSEPHILVGEVEVRGHDRRMDLLLIGKRLTAFEIKSDVDTLARLQDQAASYSRVADRAVLVVGPRHAARAGGLVPEWWALWHGSRDRTGNVRLREVRRGRTNPQVEGAALTELLLADELRHELSVLGIRGLSGLPTPTLRLLLQAELTAPALQNVVRHRLLCREPWRTRALSIAPRPAAAAGVRLFPQGAPAAA